MNDPTPAGRTRQRRKSARPQELLQAALELFVEKGLANTRAEDVAARAGVSKGTLYLYFTSKDDLFMSVVRHHLTAVIMEGEDILSRHTGSAAELLNTLAITWWQRVTASRAAGLLVVMMSEARQFPELALFYVNEVVVPSRKLAAKAIQYGIDRGEFRPLDVDAAVQSLMATLQFLLIYHEITSICVTDPGAMAPEQYLPSQIDMLLRGMLK